MLMLMTPRQCQPARSRQGSFNSDMPCKETLIVERRIIAATYLRGWFVLDFISTVPWSRIAARLCTKKFVSGRYFASPSFDAACLPISRHMLAAKVDTMVGPGGGPMVTVAKLAKVCLGRETVRVRRFRPSLVRKPRQIFVFWLGLRSSGILRLKFIRIIRLMKMLRAKKLKDIWEQVEKRIGSVAIVQGMMLIRVLLVVVGICHWNACLFWIVGARESIVTDFMPTPGAKLSTVVVFMPRCYLRRMTSVSCRRTLKDQFDRMPHWTTISRIC